MEGLLGLLGLITALIANAMIKELNETYTEWKVKTRGLDLNDSLEKNFKLNEKYKE